MVSLGKTSALGGDGASQASLGQRAFQGLGVTRLLLPPSTDLAPDSSGWTEGRARCPQRGRAGAQEGQHERLPPRTP